MSLRNYLFVLIGTLIFLLTISQLFLVTWLEKSFAQEVDNKARNISEQVIELAVNQMFDQEKNNALVVKKLSDLNVIKDDKSTIKTETIIQNSKDDDVVVYEFNTNTSDINKKKVLEHIKKIKEHNAMPSSSNVEKSNLQTIDKQVLKEQFQVIIDTLHTNRHTLKAKTGETLVIKSPAEISSRRVTIESNQPTKKIKSLVNSIQISLIIGALIALIFAYWLSVQFNKPLKELSIGFKNLAKGDYETKVKSQGVKEIKSTISLFNTMVDKLNSLSKAEKQYKEVAHLAELGDVSRGLAHALRNPIHTIGLAIEQLGNDDISHADKKSIITTIQSKISNIDKSIKALLSLTTTGIDRTENVPVLAVIQDVILEYKSCQHRPMKFVVEVSPKLAIKGSETEIRNIIHTLINNACEASDIDSEVVITGNEIFSNKPNKDINKLEITVIDQGSGLDPEIEKQLFQPHISSKPEGAGMGLYIANRVISLHYQGSINLANRTDESQGTMAKATFLVNS